MDRYGLYRYADFGSLDFIEAALGGARGLIIHRLRKMRMKSGLTQEQVARHLNVTRGAVGHWERGKNQPSYEMLVSLAHLYNTSTAYLIGETDDPSPLAPPTTGEDPKDGDDGPAGWELLTEDEKLRVQRVARAFQEVYIRDMLREKKENSGNT